MCGHILHRGRCADTFRPNFQFAREIASKSDIYILFERHTQLDYVCVRSDYVRNSSSHRRRSALESPYLFAYVFFSIPNTLMFVLYYTSINL